MIMLFVLFAALISTPSYGDEIKLAPIRKMLENSGFPENTETRRKFSDQIFSPSYQSVEKLFEIYSQKTNGKKVQFEMRKTIREWYLIFRSQRGKEPWADYPLWGRGTWIIKKNLLSGEFIQAKIFLQDDENTFVRIFPMSDNRSRMDVVLYGRQFGEDVIIPKPFSQLLLSPFAEVVALSNGMLNWEKIFPNPDRVGNRYVKRMVETLFLYSDEIQEIPDAAVDEGGQNVYIETGDPVTDTSLHPGNTGMNCSGYVKWVVDGIYSAWSGVPGTQALPVELLRKPTVPVGENPWNDYYSAFNRKERNALETILRDPTFGLDWNRNLAYAVEKARLGEEPGEHAKKILEVGESLGLPYYPRNGFNLDDLASALYQLASDNPGSVYLAAVNSTFKPLPYSSGGQAPKQLNQYWHVSVLAPWFENGDDGEERGKFRVAVLDTGEAGETLLPIPDSQNIPRYEAFIRNRALLHADLGKDDEGNLIEPEVMVHLIRVRVPDNFEIAPLSGF